jgi:hypothetical protein
MFPVHRTFLQLEEIRHDGGPAPERPLLRGAAMALVGNPLADRYEPDLEPLMKQLEPLGKQLAVRLAEALGGPEAVQGYGKGAIVGLDGELEHGALWHVPGGYAMREALGNALAIVPSTKKVGGPGTRLDVPITHKDASYVRSHFDAMEVGCPDGPAGDELLFVLVMSTGSRVHARVGGLRPDQIKERNGLR